MDTWEWDGKRWTQVATMGPSSRGRSAMVYDEKRREMVLSMRGIQQEDGGEPHYVFDTWEWDGRRWTEAK